MALKIAALAGGVGGAKLVDGLAAVLRAEDLIVIVNTGDDFEHFGLTICPDLDTVTYTLAGLANPKTGWGLADETWNVLETIGRLGGPTWFRLGDRDLGLHLERTRSLGAGERLSALAERVCETLGVAVKVLPMSDDPVRTIVLTDEGELSFQDYFVARRCEPAVRGFRFQGIDDAAPAPGVLSAIRDADCVVLCPSNPWVSLDPILAVPGVRGAVKRKLVFGVSPIVGGKAIKGPAAKMYAELGHEPSALTVAAHYREILSTFAIDERDASLTEKLEAMGVRTHAINIVMKNRKDRRRLAGEIIEIVSEEVFTVVKS